MKHFPYVFLMAVWRLNKSKSRTQTLRRRSW